MSAKKNNHGEQLTPKQEVAMFEDNPYAMGYQRGGFGRRAATHRSRPINRTAARVAHSTGERATRVD